MAKFVEIGDFYKTLDQSLQQDVGDFGHFNIFKVEDLVLPQQGKPSYSRRNFYKVSLVSGHSRIHYADQVVEVADAALVFTNPMIPYIWERVGERHEGYVCIFTEQFFNRVGNIKEYPIFQATEKAIIPLQGAEFTFFAQIFGRMDAELQGDYPQKYDLLRALLLELVHEAQKIRPSTAAYHGSSANEKITALFLELLERQFPIEWDRQAIQLQTPTDFAERLNLHVNHLNKALKEITGQTTSQLIQDRLMQEAQVLLRATDWPVNRIAWSLGFAEANHFSTYFKKRSGQSPKAYRTLHLEGETPSLD